MGWGMSMGIGWPNASNQGGTPTVFSFLIYVCADDGPFVAYSTTNGFVPGVAYIYQDINLTIPYTGDYNGVSQGYNTNFVDANGFITEGTTSCGG